MKIFLKFLLITVKKKFDSSNLYNNTCSRFIDYSDVVIIINTVECPPQLTREIRSHPNVVRSTYPRDNSDLYDTVVSSYKWEE